MGCGRSCQGGSKGSDLLQQPVQSNADRLEPVGRTTVENRPEASDKGVVRLLVFRLEGRGYALSLAAVVRVVRAVEITELPKAPEIVLGVVNVGGAVVPVFDMRRRFRLPCREVQLTDQLIVAQTSRRTVVLLADCVMGLVEVPTEDIAMAPAIVPGIEQVQGIVKLPDGLVLIHDLESFLSLEEGRVLAEAMERV